MVSSGLMWNPWMAASAANAGTAKEATMSHTLTFWSVFKFVNP